MYKLGKIRQLRWKERLENIKIARFESDLLKTNEDIAPHQSREILQMFVWSRGRGTIPQKAVNFSRNFAELYLFPLNTYHFQT